MAAAFVVFVQRKQIAVIPVGEGADPDASLAGGSANDVWLRRMRAAGKFLRVGEAVIVRIPARAIVGIASAVGAFAESTVIKRVEAVLIFPSVGQTIAIAVGLQGIGFTPLFPAVVNAVVVGVAIDESIEIFVLTKSILQTIAIRVGKGWAGLGPCFKVVDEIVGPIARVGSCSCVSIAPGSER